MNSADFERAWRSPGNTATPAVLTAARDRLFADLRRRQRARRLFLALVFGALLLLSARVALELWPRGGTPTIHPARDWASLLFLAVPWTGFALLARQMRRHERGPGQASEAIGDTVRGPASDSRTPRRDPAAAPARGLAIAGHG